MAGEDDDLVASLLKSDSSVDNEPLGAAYAEIRVEEDHRPLVLVLVLVSHDMGPAWVCVYVWYLFVAMRSGLWFVVCGVVKS